MSPKLVIAECNADTLLAEVVCRNLVVRVDHGAGSEVIQQLRGNSFGIAIIDDDKRKHPYCKHFKTLEKADEVELLNFVGEGKNHFMIIVSPAFERWIITAAETVNLQAELFGVPLNFEEFKSYCKRQSARNSPELRALITAIVDAESAHTTTLRKFIERALDE